MPALTAPVLFGATLLAAASGCVLLEDFGRFRFDGASPDAGGAPDSADERRDDADAADADADAADGNAADGDAPDGDARRELGDLTIGEGRLPRWWPIGDRPRDTSTWAVLDVTDYGADPDANPAVDDAVAIQAAIDDADGPTVVLLPAGQYDLSTGVHVARSELVLRGEGVRATTLVFATGDAGAYHPACGRAMLLVCSTDAAGPASPWVGGYVRGTSRIEVESASGFSAGDWVILEEHDDPELLDEPREASNAILTHLARLDSVDGTVIVLDRPLRFDFNSTGREVTRVAPLHDVGLEAMTLRYGHATSEIEYEIPVRFRNTVESWVVGVEMSDFWSRVLDLRQSARVLVRGNRFSSLLKDTPNHRSAVWLDWAAHDNVVEHNLFVDTRVGVELHLGAAGNVVAYNAFRDTVCERSVLFDGGYAVENLLEGNSADCAIDLTNRWGRVGPRNTLFRNRTTGPIDDRRHLRTVQEADWPLSAELNLLLNGAGGLYGHDQLVVLDVDGLSTGMWIERNVTRAPPSLASPEPSTTLVENVVGMRAPAAWNTLDFPASLYLAGRPAFWPPAAPWPAIGADVDDFTSPAGLEPLPAEDL